VREPFAMLANREWLDEATKTIGQFWKPTNARRNSWNPKKNSHNPSQNGQNSVDALML
jgi:hypothetical protein